MKPAVSARARVWTRDHRGFLQQVLHRVARLGLVKQEGGLSLVESKLRGHVDPELFVVCEEYPNRREELGEDEVLRYMERSRQFLRRRVAGASLSAGSCQLNQEACELE